MTWWVGVCLRFGRGGFDPVASVVLLLEAARVVSCKAALDSVPLATAPAAAVARTTLHVDGGSRGGADARLLLAGRGAPGGSRGQSGTASRGSSGCVGGAHCHQRVAGGRGGGAVRGRDPAAALCRTLSGAHSLRLQRGAGEGGGAVAGGGNSEGQGQAVALCGTPGGT